MKTDTVNTAKWRYNGTDIETDYEDCPTGVCSMYAYEDEAKDAALIVAAVNACKEINPDNPLNVAKVLPQLFEALKGLVENCAIDARGEPNYYAMALKAIKNATK